MKWDEEEIENLAELGIYIVSLGALLVATLAKVYHQLRGDDDSTDC